MQTGKADCVVLFDIDGTLLAGPGDGPSAGKQAMNLAIEKVSGRAGLYDAVDFAGRTDVQIARALLIAAGDKAPSDGAVNNVVDLYVSFLPETIQTTPYTVIGSPSEAIAVLRRAGATVALGTGNVRAGGKIKLKSAGIHHLFDMSQGGFGEDGSTRAELLQQGAISCDPTGRRPVVIVGDTPHDIAAAHAIGAPCIGIPYGRNTAEVLSKAGADTLVETIDAALITSVVKVLS